MRLIDADALLEKMKKTDRYFNIVFDIEDAPTVDAAEVVKKTFKDGMQLMLSEDFEQTQTKELIDKIVESLETMERDMRTFGNCEKANGVSSAIWLIEEMVNRERI